MLITATEQSFTSKAWINTSWCLAPTDKDVVHPWTFVHLGHFFLNCSSAQGPTSETAQYKQDCWYILFRVTTMDSNSQRVKIHLLFRLDTMDSSNQRVKICRLVKCTLREFPLLSGFQRKWHLCNHIVCVQFSICLCLTVWDLSPFTGANKICKGEEVSKKSVSWKLVAGRRRLLATVGERPWCYRAAVRAYKARPYYTRVNIQQVKLGKHNTKPTLDQNLNLTKCESARGQKSTGNRFS